MRVDQSAVWLSGSSSQSLISSKTIKGSVKEGKSGNDSSVKVSLSRDTSEQNKLQSSSQVQRSNGSYAYFSSSDFARKLSSAVSEMSVDIRSWFGNVQADENGHLIEISSTERIKTQEGMSLEATGKVQTEDGRIIDFMLALDFKRDITEERSSLFSGRVTQMADPLMINMQGEMVQLTDQWFDFDLLADGSNQGLLITEKGSGYLAFDKNQNGQIDDGSELFGPNTNNGFAELALYDEDGNGWIDENDSIFSQLGVLSFENGEAVFTNAKDAGLGAIYLGYADANYEVLNKKGETQGVIRGNGVALTEEGQVLLVQEVHLRLQHPNTKTSQVGGLTIRSQALPPVNEPLRQAVSSELTRQNLRDWVANIMSNPLEPLDLNGQFQGMTFFGSSPSLSTPYKFDLDTKKNESPFNNLLRATIDAMREMKKAQKAFHHKMQHKGYKAS